MRYPFSAVTLALLLIWIGSGCINLNSDRDREQPRTQEMNAILETINNETRAAFERNYDAWQAHWIHAPFASKTYLNFVDSSFSESVGWTDIDNSVKTFFREHPEPEPAPALVTDIHVRIYHDGAYVYYEQMDSVRGRKRETRFLEKENARWKIAGMHTTIYGFD